MDNITAFLNLIGKSEGATYNTLVGGGTFSGTAYPNIIVSKYNSSAAGKYQINKATYKQFAPVAGVTDFTPDSQDKLAIAIIKFEGAYNDILIGNIASAINNLSNRWASFPKGNNNLSYYAPQHAHQLSLLLQWFNEFKDSTTVANVVVKKKIS